MPTKVKRCQVLLKEKALEEVEKISEQTGLSLSKVISLLTEEALLIRKGDLAQSEQDEPPTSAGTVAPDNGPQRGFSEFYGMNKGFLKKDYLRKKANEHLEQCVEPSVNLSDDDIELLGKLKKLKALEEAGII